MTFQKNPKQKSSYPATLERFEKGRQRDWIKTKLSPRQELSFKGKFTRYLRKNPNS